MNLPKKEIRELVHQLLREINCFHPPVDVELLARWRNVSIHRQVVEDDFSGYLCRIMARNSAVIGVNARHHPNRQRFTIAHELGHFLLHTGDDTPHIDRQFVVMRRDAQSSRGIDPEEMEANCFASELLMPEQYIVEDLERRGFPDFLDERFVEELSKKYRVSRQAMTIRLTSLGYL